ncbi:MAG: metal ABC transporter substrate-binding protein [Aeromicrobium sp.]
MTVTAIAVLLLLTGCGSSTDGNGKTRVVASFYPFAFVAEQVGGSYANVDNLTAPGAEPHDIELKPKQVGAVQNADLVIFEKSFQAAVDQAVDQADRPAKGTIDVAKLVSLKNLQAGVQEEGHEHGSKDPHSWLDPRNMIVVTKAVSTQLSQIDPAHAKQFMANAQKLITQLSDLDATFTAGLKTCRTRTIVTSHAAFQYLANRYGLTQIPIAGIDPSNEPSPAQLADITKLVHKDKITTIFTEELVSPAIADTVARETGAKTATLDPIEGLSDKTAHENYLTLMAKNLNAIAKADNCS